MSAAAKPARSDRHLMGARTMNQLYILAQLSLGRAVHDNLRTSNSEAMLAVTGSGLSAWLAQINWAAMLAVVALVVTTVGGTALQLYKQWRMVKLDISARERELASRPPGNTERRRPRHI